jgi:hypothetical protein
MTRAVDPCHVRRFKIQRVTILKEESSMDLSERKKLALASFSKRMHELHLEPGKLKVVRDRATYSFPDGTSALIHFAVVTGGYAKGSFGAYTGLLMSDGPIYKIMEEAGLAAHQAMPPQAFLRASAQSLAPNRAVHPFMEGTNPDTVVSEMVAQIRELYLPIIQKFTGKYAGAVEFILEGGAAYVRNPFTTCVILLGLGDAFDRLDSVAQVAEAKREKGFYDYDRVTDYRKAIVDPVRKWFKDHPSAVLA